jgi:methionyl-tRNA formyltransferase
MTLNKFNNNLVVHESALPAGKGWSPITWQILEGQNRVQVTLLEAAEAVDSGPIYDQCLVEFDGYELIDELRTIQAKATFDLCRRFVAGYPDTKEKSREQFGIESFYKRRRPVDSELDAEKSLAEQFNLLRVVDNERYPAFFNICGNRYILKVIWSKSND